MSPAVLTLGLSLPGVPRCSGCRTVPLGLTESSPLALTALICAQESLSLSLTEEKELAARSAAQSKTLKEEIQSLRQEHDERILQMENQMQQVPGLGMSRGGVLTPATDLSDPVGYL